MLRALGEPKRAEVQKLYRSNELTIVNVVWAPWMTILPHNHHMWAVIGIYTGREDNIFWRRLPEHRRAGSRRPARERCRSATPIPLGRDIIHSVTNPIPRFTGAIHVYGGDFFDTSHRSQWDPETLREGPYDMTRTMRTFEVGERRRETADEPDRRGRVRLRNGRQRPGEQHRDAEHDTGQRTVHAPPPTRRNRHVTPLSTHHAISGL